MERRANYVMIGLFTFAAIAAAFAFVFWIHHTSDKKTGVAYRVIFDGAVSGLRVGSSVLFNGIRVGEVTALKGLDFEIYDGEFVSVVGQSGCGKSTLLKVLAGLLPYTAGSVELNGRPLRGPTPEAAVVFQSPVLLPWRTVLDNVLLLIEFRKWPVTRYRQSAVDLLAHNPKPDRAAIVEHMSTNICRCGTYQRIVRAIERVAKEA